MRISRSWSNSFISVPNTFKMELRKNYSSTLRLGMEEAFELAKSMALDHTWSKEGKLEKRLQQEAKSEIMERNTQKHTAGKSGNMSPWGPASFGDRTLYAELIVVGSVDLLVTFMRHIYGDNG